MTTEIFEPDYAVLRDFEAAGKSILNSAKTFGGTFERLARFIKQGRQLPAHGTADLMDAYRLVQIHNRVKNPEAGKRLAAEVLRWQATKIIGPGFHGPQEVPLLESTAGMDENFERVHRWFD